MIIKIMQHKYLIIYWMLFVTFGTLFALSINYQLKQDFILLNENIGMLLFCISIPLKMYRMRVGQYLIVVALLILLFSPLNYSFTITEGDLSVTHNGAKSTSLISPITFLILMLFLAFNYQAMIDIYLFLMKGSGKEQVDKEKKLVAFYYDKFNNCSIVELNDIFRMYSDYPYEAQIALKRIKEEKEID